MHQEFKQEMVAWTRVIAVSDKCLYSRCVKPTANGIYCWIECRMDKKGRSQVIFFFLNS